MRNAPFIDANIYRSDNAGHFKMIFSHLSTYHS